MKSDDASSGSGSDAQQHASFERVGAPRVEVLLIGADLLRGQVVDANASTLAATVARRGGTIQRITVVNDETDSIVNAMRAALAGDPHLVITSGGMGPATDDRTLDAVAAALNVPLAQNPGARTMVEEAYQRLYRARLVNTAGMNQVREKLCGIPLGGTPLENRRGVSPGVFYNIPGRGAVLCLPGRPEELRAVLKSAEKQIEAALPDVAWARREIEAPTADESSLRPLLERLAEEFAGLFISSRPVGQTRQDATVLIFMEAHADSREEATAVVNQAVRRLLALASGSP